MIPKNENEFKEHVLEIVRTLFAIMAEKDRYLKEHSERVANNCSSFCRNFRLMNEDETEKLYHASLLHDIGKISLPLTILEKTEALTEDEYTQVKKHAVTGERILSNLAIFEDILPMIRHHHEAVDGSGYPDGCKGDEIPLGARIIRLFDSYDGKIAPRPPKAGMSMEDALAQINEGAGQIYDEKLLKNFRLFIQSTEGEPDDYMEQKEAAKIKEIFIKVLTKFKQGKLNPPVMAQVVREVQKLMKATTATAEDIASAIEKDPVISLKLISVANSPIYRGVQEIRNVKSAIPRLGLKETLNVIMAISNKSLYESKRVQYKILMDKLWVHSLAAAFGAKIIAQKLKLDDTEKYFLMGLVHDIGKVTLLKAFSDEAQNKNFGTAPIIANIQEAHLTLGALLLKRWGFGDEFLNVVQNHEGKELNVDSSKELLVVNLANMITRSIGFSVFEEEVDFADLDSAKFLEIDPEKALEIGEDIKGIIRDVAHLF